MKCKKCGSLIQDTDLNCPGCATSVEELTMNGLIEADAPKKETPIEMPKEEKKKHYGFLIFLIVLLILLAGAVWFYFLVLCAPKTILKKTVSKVADALNSEEEYSQLQGGSLAISIDYDSTEENATLELLKNLKINMDYAIDYKTMEGYLKADAIYKENSAFAFESVFKNGKQFYLQVPDYLDKVLRLELEEVELKDSEVSREDLLYVYEKSKDAFFNSLKKENYSSSKEEIVIAGEKQKARKSSIILSPSELQRVANEICATLKEDDRYVKIMASLLDISEVEVRNSLSEKVELDEGIEIHVYTTGYKNDFAKLELVDDSKESISIEKASSKQYNFAVKLEDFETQGSVTIENNDVTIQLNYNMEEITLKVTVKGSTKSLETLPTFDTTNSVSIEELTEEDYLNMIEKIQQNQLFIDFASEMMPYLEGTDDSALDYNTDDTDADYDFDMDTF